MREPAKATTVVDAVATDLDALWGAIGRREAAVGRLLAGLIRRVCRPVLQRKGVPSAELADLEQDVLAFVWAAASTQSAPRNLDGYLYWRARAAFRSYVREQERRRAAEPLDADPAEPYTHPLDTLAAQGLADALQLCTRELNANLRQAWNARYRDGLENRAAAAALGISVNAFAVRIFRASRQIKTRLMRLGWLADG